MAALGFSSQACNLQPTVCIVSEWVFDVPRFIKTAIFGFFLALPLPQLATAQTDNEGKTIEHWRITCADGPCRAFFNIQQNDQIVVSWTLLHDPAQGTTSSLVKIPTGTALPPGLRIYADDDTFFDAPFQVCEPDGCTAIFVMDDAMLTALSDKTTARIAFIRYGENETVAYEVPVAGLKEAVDSL